MKNIEKIIDKLENENNELLLRAKIVIQFISLREEKGYSQKEVASMMGVSQQLISRFEKMEHSPTTSFLYKYASILGADIDAILSFKNVTDTSLKDQETKISDIVTYKYGEISLDVNFDFENETIWLSQDKISKLFETDRTSITKHIQNIYLSNELKENETCAKIAQVASNGKKYNILSYNLDMVISIGYRVNSKRGIEFRRWATSILKEYMYKGYALNKSRLDVLNKTIEIQNRMLSSSLNIDSCELSSVINEYTKALNILDEYDHQNLCSIKGNDTIYRLSYEEARRIINSLRFNNESPLFGIEKEKGKLSGILEAVYQNVFGEDVYKSVESKAAHLLYFLVKDHPFIDGCKRIAATLFLEFLNKNHILYRNGSFGISNDALVAVTLLTAESKPEEMELIVKVIENLLERK